MNDLQTLTLAPVAGSVSVWVPVTAEDAALMARTLQRRSINGCLESCVKSLQQQGVAVVITPLAVTCAEVLSFLVDRRETL